MGWSLAQSALTVAAACNTAATSCDRYALATLHEFERACIGLPQRTGQREFAKKVAMIIRPGQAYYAAPFARLYFADRRDRPIELTTRRVFASLGLEYESSQISSDGHGVFVNGYCLELPQVAATPVRVALRLIGIQI